MSQIVPCRGTCDIRPISHFPFFPKFPWKRQEFSRRSTALKTLVVCPHRKIVHSLSGQLSWTHLRQIIYVGDPLRRDFYAEMCRIERWSTRTLYQKIQSMLFERTALSKKPSKRELRLRSTLHRRGMRFRVGFAADPGQPRRIADLVFTKARLCVFVDGCFCHGCPRHFTCPATNVAWWREKIDGNRLRDQSATVR